MSEINPDALEAFLKSEMLQLMPKSFTIKKAHKLTGLPKEEIKISYLNVRSRITKVAIKTNVVIRNIFILIFLIDYLIL